jgi:hypothetical protein
VTIIDVPKPPVILKSVPKVGHEYAYENTENTNGGVNP